MTKRKEIEKKISSITEIKPALLWAQQMAEKGLQAGPVVLRLGRERRSLSQNSKLWPMLTDLSEQIEWHGKRLTPEQWKDLVTGSLAAQESVPGLNGGVVFISSGKSTSKMNKEELSDMIEFIYSEFGGVKWTDPKEHGE